MRRMAYITTFVQLTSTLRSEPHEAYRLFVTIFTNVEVASDESRLDPARVVCHRTQSGDPGGGGRRLGRASPKGQSTLLAACPRRSARALSKHTSEFASDCGRGWGIEIEAPFPLRGVFIDTRLQFVLVMIFDKHDTQSFPRRSVEVDSAIEVVHVSSVLKNPPFSGDCPHVCIPPFLFRL